LAQITSITSEALQAKIRQLLPSQQGFGEDLQAQNVIVPIIDLTETASGSSLRQDLQTALNHGGSTAFNASNATVTLANTGGFYRVNYTSVITIGSNNSRTSRIELTDGSTIKILVMHELDSGGASADSTTQGDFVFFVNSGDTLQAVTSSSDATMSGSVRQIADLNGNLVNPVGFTPQ
jgi:hypothetical protein